MSKHACNDPNCHQAATELDAEIATGIDQSWVQGWTAGNWREHKDVEEGLKFIKTCPPKFRDAMRKFPPDCMVRGNRPLRVPANGGIGIVSGYTEDRNGDIDLVVRNTPTSTAGAQVAQDWVEPVGYHAGMTPEVINELLADA